MYGIETLTLGTTAHKAFDCLYFTDSITTLIEISGLDDGSAKKNINVYWHIAMFTYAQRTNGPEQLASKY